MNYVLWFLSHLQQSAMYIQYILKYYFVLQRRYTEQVHHVITT
jgi:hypothetical protein